MTAVSPSLGLLAGYPLSRPPRPLPARRAVFSKRVNCRCTAPVNDAAVSVPERLGLRSRSAGPCAHNSFGATTPLPMQGFCVGCMVMCSHCTCPARGFRDGLRPSGAPGGARAAICVAPVWYGAAAVAAVVRLGWAFHVCGVRVPICAPAALSRVSVADACESGPVWGRCVAVSGIRGALTPSLCRPA